MSNFNTGIPLMSSATLLIRPATLQDCRMIRQIATVAWQVAYQNIISAEFMAHELEREYSDSALAIQMREQAHQFLVLEQEDMAIGFVSYCWKDDIGTIHKLYLEPHTKGKGLGKALMQEVEEQAAHKALKALELKVNRSNPAVQFYQKQGYSIVKEVDTLVGEGFLRTDYLMRKSL
jgi:ribosomal protein S18 acetylase RimI-like enzyme